MDKTEILQIGEEHSDYIAQIVEMTEKFSGESHIYERMGFNKEKFAAYISAYNLAGGAVLAAKRSETILGYAICFIDTHYIDEKNFEIITIFVAKEHRRTDAGRMLAKALVDTMDINGCKYGQVAICCAMKENEALINSLTANMFKKHGFYQIGTIMGRRGKSWE